MQESTLLRVELGAGSRNMDGWVTLDISNSADIQCDCSIQPLPFADETVNELYASHFLEHFSFPKPMLYILEECKRVLSPDGKLSIAVPDASIYIRAYMEEKAFPEVIPVYKPAFFFNSPIDSINYIAYMNGQHKHMFDLKNLLAILKIAGFSDVQSRNFDPTIDIEKRRPQSIYAVAYK